MRRTLLTRKWQPIGACTMDDVELDVEIVAQEGQSATVYCYDNRWNRKENMTRIIFGGSLTSSGDLLVPIQLRGETHTRTAISR